MARADPRRRSRLQSRSASGAARRERCTARSQQARASRRRSGRGASEEPSSPALRDENVDRTAPEHLLSEIDEPADKCVRHGALSERLGVAKVLETLDLETRPFCGELESPAREENKVVVR